MDLKTYFLLSLNFIALALYIIILYTEITKQKKVINKLTFENQKLNQELKNLDDNSKLLKKQKNKLIQELNHKVNNNLQLIISLLNIQSRDTTIQKSDKEFIDKFKSRVFTLSIINKNSLKEIYSEEIDFKEFVKEIVDNNLTSILLDSTIVINSENAIINTKKAIPIGLIINEILVIISYILKEEKNIINITLKNQTLEKLILTIEVKNNNSIIDYKSIVSLDSSIITFLATYTKAEINYSFKNNGFSYDIIF